MWRLVFLKLLVRTIINWNQWVKKKIISFDSTTAMSLCFHRIVNSNLNYKFPFYCFDITLLKNLFHIFEASGQYLLNLFTIEH